VIALAERHEVLRTTYRLEAGGPVQVARPTSGAMFRIVDLRGRPAGQREAATELRDEMADRPFDLAQGPVFEAALALLGEGRSLFCLRMHHIVDDEWSTGILFRELSALYRAFHAGEADPLPPLAVQYADYAHWQRGWLQSPEAARQLAYWRATLAGVREDCELAPDRSPGTTGASGVARYRRIPAGRLRLLRALGREEGATLYMTLLAALGLVLESETGSADVVVGSPVANRRPVETEELIGFFVNTIVLRADLSDQPTGREALRRARSVCLDAYANQEMPFGRVVQEVRPGRRASGFPIVNVMLNLHNIEGGRLALPGVAVEREATPEGAARTGLSLYAVEEDGGLLLKSVHDPGRYSDKRAAGFLARLVRALTRLGSDPDARGGY
jgi:hypothetical protein